jgi:hypothetical protein
MHAVKVTEALEGVDFTPVYFAKGAEKSDFEFAVRFDGGYQPPGAYLEKPEASHRPPMGARGQSVYSEANGAPVMMSSTPILFQESSLACLSKQSGRFGGGHMSMTSDARSTSERDSYTSPQMPPQSAADSARSRVLENSRKLSSGSVRSVSSHNSTSSTGSARQGLPSNPKSKLSTSNKF